LLMRVLDVTAHQLQLLDGSRFEVGWRLDWILLGLRDVRWTSRCWLKFGEDPVNWFGW
jgi:hypothetical protein